MFSQNDNYNNKDKSKRIERLKMKQSPALFLTQSAFLQKHQFFCAIYFWALNIFGVHNQAHLALALQLTLEVLL